jgi:hypothetical protein
LICSAIFFISFVIVALRPSQAAVHACVLLGNADGTSLHIEREHFDLE